MDEIVMKNSIEMMIDIFHEHHEKLRGSKELGQHIEFSTWRVTALGKTEKFKIAYTQENERNTGNEKIKEHRMSYFKELGGMVETAIYDGTTINPGDVIHGHAIIEEETTTIVVFPRNKVTVSSLGNYIVDIGLES